MALTEEEREQWLETVREEIIDPERRIVDPHHHMWIESGLPCLLYTSPSPRDKRQSRMPSSA